MPEFQSQTQDNLGQVQPADTNPQPLVSGLLSAPDQSDFLIGARPGGWVVRTIIVCNTGAASSYRIFFDAAGATFDGTTALFYDVPIPANTTHHIDTYITSGNPLAVVKVRSADAAQITFTAFGELSTP